MVNDAYFIGDVTLQGTPCRIQLSFNERTSLYYLDLFTEMREIIVLGLTLVPNTYLRLPAKATDNGLTGMFYLAPFSDNLDATPTPSTLADDFTLLYIYEA